MNEVKLREQVMALMNANTRKSGQYTYTIPSPEIYPFQWLWDSCFHSLIYLQCNEIDRAKQEIISVVSRPLSSGLIPHIIYWEKATNWGREKRGDMLDTAWGTEGTSSLTQPPLMAYVLLRIFKKDKDRSFLNSMYPVLCAHYEYLLKNRDSRQHHLIGIINPDESGEDNSPRFDTLLGLLATQTADQHLDKRIKLIEKNKSCNFDALLCMKNHFWFKDVSFNSIMIVALDAMAHIATLLGKDEDAKIWTGHGEKIKEAMRQWMLEDGVFWSVHGVDYKKIKTETWAMFMPLFAGIVSDAEAKDLIKNYLLNEEKFWTEYPVPSTAQTEESYDAVDGFWRGPTWMAPNWFIYHGLKKYGFESEAQILKEKSIALLEKSGFREQYNPETGEGIGAREFTWGGLILDME